jgi:protein TonB
MFEQATLSNGPAGTRAWTTFIGITSQVALVSVAVLIPMVFPQVLPTARILETLVPPLPPGPPAPKPLDDTKHVPASGHVLKKAQISLLAVQPSRVPREIYNLVEEPASSPVVIGADGPPSTGPSIIAGIIGASGPLPVAPPPRVAAAPVKPVEPAPIIKRYKEGGNVMLGAPIHKTEPVYPTIAKTARVSGSVELECVVGVDGHIREVKVKSGNPLLIKAAVDAAWGWMYGPSKLNGEPIEIVTMLTFTFRLN